MIRLEACYWHPNMSVCGSLMGPQTAFDQYWWKYYLDLIASKGEYGNDYI